jgi:uncharacterized integral membrane protein
MFRETVRENRNMNAKLVLALLLMGMAVVFVIQNVAMVEVGFLGWRFSLSSALLIFSTLTIGFVMGWSLHSYLLYRKSKDNQVYLR